MNQITDNLYISNAPSVRDLDADHQFNLVVTLGYLDQFGYERPVASDTGDDYVFPDGEHDYAVFRDAVDVVREALHRGDCVLVHCQAGVSRSAGVCSAVLAAEHDLHPEEALSLVEDVRPKVNPTPEVWKSVTAYVATVSE